MNRLTTSIFALTVGAVLLTGCSGTEEVSSTVASSAAPASSIAESIAPTASSAATSSPTNGSETETILATLNEAAGLGDSITVSEIDLQANGLDTSNVLAFSGAESRLSSENGGIVMVFQVQPGSEAAMVSALEAYRDLRASDDRYAEFATARDNTANARIGSVGEYVYYAVSATGDSGGYDALDIAISELSI